MALAGLQRLGVCVTSLKRLRLRPSNTSVTVRALSFRATSSVVALGARTGLTLPNGAPTLERIVLAGGTHGMASTLSPRDLLVASLPATRSAFPQIRAEFSWLFRTAALPREAISQETGRAPCAYPRFLPRSCAVPALAPGRGSSQKSSRHSCTHSTSNRAFGSTSLADGSFSSGEARDIGTHPEPTPSQLLRPRARCPQELGWSAPELTHICPRLRCFFSRPRRR